MKVLLTLLVRLFPADFRDQFEADMLDQVSADYDRARNRSWRGGLWFAVLTASDLARGLVAERWNPTWVTPQAPKTVWEGKTMMMNGWAKDLGHAVRGLRRSPGFTAVTVITLGVAIGVNAGIFSVVDAVLLDPLPYPDGDQLVSIAASAPGSDMPEEFGVSVEFFVQYRDQSTSLEALSVYNNFTASLRVEDRTERIPMAVMSTEAFVTLQSTPILGRLPTLEDEGGVALISHALWATWFGSDPSVLGRTYEMADTERTIIGVMGPDF